MQGAGKDTPQRLTARGCRVVGRGAGAVSLCPHRPSRDRAVVSRAILPSVIPSHLSCHPQLCVSYHRPHHRPVSCFCHVAQPAGSVVTLALAVLHAASLSHLSVHLLVHPSILVGLQLPAARSCLVFADTSAMFYPQVRAWGRWLSKVHLLKAQDVFLPFPSMMEGCARTTLVPHPALLFLIPMSPVWLSTTGPINDKAQRCRVQPHQRRPEPATQSGAGLHSFLCIPPPSAASPSSCHPAVPPVSPSPCGSPLMAHHPPAIHTPACSCRPRPGDTR